jgi:signal transduction histidine kinase
MISSVFRNLLKNAIQHNDKDTAEVTISVNNYDDTVTVNVADNGPGVPDGRKETVFGKGEQGLDSSGTGMGLYLVNTLVSAHSGGVWIDDNEPEGAIFTVELPTA